MGIFRHIFVIIFLIFLLLFVVLVINKQVLHFKLLKKLYPNDLSKINSYFNPLSVFYIIGLNFSIVIWFSFPIYYKKKNITFKDNIGSSYERALIVNNKRIYISFVVLVIWLLLGLIIYH
jgi:hypothetical protein